MKWTQSEPHFGDIVRVKVNFYHHYGIFIDENRIVQFGGPDNTGIDPEQIEVIVTDVYAFLNGGDLETAILERDEKKSRRTPKQAVEIALSRVGERGYNILHNNCEHFVNECVFGTAKSDFLENARINLRKKLTKK